MLTPGSLRADAIRACFIEAGFTSSLFRTVLEDRGGQVRLVCLLVSDSTAFNLEQYCRTEEDVCVCVCVSFSWEKGEAVVNKGGMILNPPTQAHKTGSVTAL